VEALSVRLLPYEIADAAENMAADETLLHSALNGSTALRFYRWREPTISLGYFQPYHVRFEHPRLESLRCVRRPSGGLTLVHHHEITYALALPVEVVGRELSTWLLRFHEIIALALARLGVTAARPADDVEPAPNDCLCFRHITRGDLILGKHKIAGSAQRRHRGALLQHGAVILAQSPYTPDLPGIEDLTRQSLSADDLLRALLETLEIDISWRLLPAEWTLAEMNRRADLATQKYNSTAWNERR
jgi:lipoate-protein ligase A